MFKTPMFLFEEDKGDGKGGGGATPPAEPTVADLVKANSTLLARLEALEGKGKAPEDDLNEKARKMRESEDKTSHDSKSLEAAIRFGLKSEEFLKTNAALLPKDIGDIFKAADKETYANAVEKDQAVKAGIVQSFFGVQANLDLLTPGVKSVLEDYLKLTKTGKAQKAQMIYDTVFEPTFETLRRVKKAEALSKGFGSSSNSEDAYKQKMMGLSKKHFLGEKI